MNYRTQAIKIQTAFADFARSYLKEFKSMDGKPLSVRSCKMRFARDGDSYNLRIELNRPPSNEEAATYFQKLRSVKPGLMFVDRNKTYKVVRMNHRAPKFPVVAEQVDTYRRYKFATSYVVKCLTK